MIVCAAWPINSFDLGKEVNMAPVLIPVRTAARELGVHENTLRRWADSGLIRVVRLPSGVRRFRPEDIAAAQRAMYDNAAREAIEHAEPSQHAEAVGHAY